MFLKINIISLQARAESTNKITPIQIYFQNHSWHEHTLVLFNLKLYLNSKFHICYDKAKY